MISDANPSTDSLGRHDQADLEQVNDILAEWAARSASNSAALIDRLEAMGYDVRGKSEAEIAETLHRPPTRAATR